jgi:hypothetical protein
VSATATQSPPTPRCPFCGARMAREQDWCLQCGNAVTTRVARPPSWRLPVGVALGTLVLFALVVVLAVGALSDDADEAATRAEPRPAARATTAPAPARQRTATTPAAAPTATVPGAAEATGEGRVPRWPRGREAYTVVAETTSDRAGAETRARELIAAGQEAGILRTDGYDFFSDGYWVVWAGQYPDRAAAEQAAERVEQEAPDAYATLIRRREE